MAQRNNSYTTEENARILAQMEAFKGRKITTSVYQALAESMGNRHTAASLMSQASRLRRGRPGAMPKPLSKEFTPEKPPCKCQTAPSTVKAQPELPIYRVNEIVDALLDVSISIQADVITLQNIRSLIIDRALLEEKCQSQQVKIEELETRLQMIWTTVVNPTNADTIGGQA